MISSEEARPRGACARLADFPYPFRAALAISTDCEFTTARAYRDIHRILADPTDLDLEVTGSLFFYTTHALCNSSISYFEGTTGTPSRDVDLIETLVRASWIDTIHAWGDFDAGGFRREMAARAVEVCARRDLHFAVFSNHGGDRNTQNVGHEGLRGYQRGDDPSAPQYHLDLTRSLGVRYFWVDPELRPSVISDLPLMRCVTARDGTENDSFQSLPRIGWSTSPEP